MGEERAPLPEPAGSSCNVLAGPWAVGLPYNAPLLGRGLSLWLSLKVCSWQQELWWGGVQEVSRPWTPDPFLQT